MQQKYTTLQGKKQKKNIVKISNYQIQYTSCQLKIFQNTKLIVKISMKFDPRVAWVSLIRSQDMCLFSQDYAVVNRFVNENKKNSKLISVQLHNQTCEFL